MYYDLVGDIHGHARALETLLRDMGYSARGKGFSHPERVLIFLGDLIDRGPDQKRVLEIARSMVASGDAIVVMGNHEFNAICYATEMDDGGHARTHSASNQNQHQAFLHAFPEHSSEYADAIAFFKTLPLWLELDDFRAIHACWHDGAMQVLGTELDEEHRIRDEVFYQRYGSREPALYDAIELLLKGPEAALPQGIVFQDQDGKTRNKARINWWNLDSSREPLFALPDHLHQQHDLSSLYRQAEDYRYGGGPELFFGHYWQRGFAPSCWTGRHIACLDYSVADGGSLIGARWHGGGMDDVEWFETKA